MTELEKLRAENQRLRQALETTRGNVDSLRYCMQGQVVTFDRWLAMVDDALKPTDDQPELF
jgi:hypothetical protein